MATLAQNPAKADDLVQTQANPANVVMPTITYDNQRYSTLDQINAQNVGKLQVAWTVLHRRAARPRGRSRW